MDWTLEVVILPVSDIARSIEFYRDQVGFHLDHDTQNEFMHVTQLTPTGSGCSIVFGDLPPHKAMEPGSLKSLQLVVADAEAARAELVGRGVECEPVQVDRTRRRRHVLRLRRPRRQHLGGAGDQGARREAADPHDHRGRFGEGADVGLESPYSGRPTSQIGVVDRGPEEGLACVASACAALQPYHDLDGQETRAPQHRRVRLGPRPPRSCRRRCRRTRPRPRRRGRARPSWRAAAGPASPDGFATITCLASPPP